MNASARAPAASRSLRARLGSRIGLRLGLGFGPLCLLMGVMAANTVWQTQAMRRQFTASVDEHVPVLKRLQALAGDVLAVNLAARDSLLAGDAAAVAAALARIEGGRSRIGDGIQQIQDALKTADGEARQIGEDRATRAAPSW